jgi:aspartyl-tRNA(Asn)/glutamyl-tRNA(Gln) amidotransferase subunit A
LALTEAQADALAGPLARLRNMVDQIERRVKDAVLFFEAIAGHDEDDPYSRRRARSDIVPRLYGGVRELLAGVLGGDFFDAQLDPEIRSVFERAVRALESLGLWTTPVEFELAAASHAAGTLITMAEAASTQDEKLREAPDEYGADIRAQLQVAEFISARQYLRGLRVRSRVQHELESLFERVDFLLKPTTSTLPVRSAQSSVPS